MNDVSPQPAPRQPRRIGGRIALGVLLACGVAVAALTGVYLSRGSIAVKLAADYLAKRGVASSITIEGLDFNGFTGSIRLGPAGAPDLTVDRIEVRFVAAPIWRRTELPRIRSVRLVRPRLKARLADGKLSFGSLQRLVDEMMAAPATGPLPDMRVEAGSLKIAAPAGPILLTGDGVLARGRLETASLRLAPARLAGFGGAAEGAAGDVTLTARGARMDAGFHVTAARLTAPGANARTVDLTGRAELPYGKTGFDKLDGRLLLQATLQAATTEGGGVLVRAPSVRLQIDGESAGDARMLALTLRGEAALSAKGGTAKGVALSVPHLDLASERFTVARSGDAWRASGPLRAILAGEGARIDADGRPLDLKHIKASGAGRLSLGGKAPTVVMAGAISTDAALSPRDAATLVGSGSELQAKAASALTAFHVDAPAYAIDFSGPRTILRLARPATVAFKGGAKAVLSSGRDLAVLAGGAAKGAFRLSLGGGGLPALSADVASFKTSGNALDARARITAAGSLSPLQDATLALDTTIHGAAGRLTVAVAACSDLKLAAVQGQGGEALLRTIQGQVCPADDAPLFVTDNAGWRAAARVKGLSAVWPASMVRIEGADATVDFHGQVGAVDIAQARIVDTATPLRFRPISVGGRLGLKGQVWNGELAVSLAAGGARLAQVKLQHDQASGVGTASFDTGQLRFAPKGLQPAAIAPITAQWLTDAQGAVQATGELGWGPTGDMTLRSHGRARTTGLDGRTPAGPIKGLAGDFELTSLAPLITAPNQKVTAARLDALLPLTDISASVGLKEMSLEVGAASATAAKGRASLDPLVIGFDPAGTLNGVLRLKGIDVGELIGTFNLSDAVSVDAKVDGVLPFALGPAGVRLSGGKVFATGPGRLSIRREALNGVVAGGATAAKVEQAPGAPPPPAVPAVPPNAVQDFAYQALENLAFEALDATVDSRPKGRLGMVFHIKGRNDPPVDRPAEIAVADLIGGHAFDKPIPLPKGTPIDLTLDTSLNLDELLSAYTGLNVTPGSAQVQP
ncbi:MAG: YdbH domain-containing protein [Caulobacteraceae bacterium]